MVKYVPAAAVIFIYRATRPTWLARTCAGGLTIVFLVLAVPSLRNGLVDAFVPYSGVVVKRGTEWPWLGEGLNWYLILEDAHGRRRKRYVSVTGYVHSRVGDFVVKKRGFQEYPHRPDDLPLSQLRKRH